MPPAIASSQFPTFSPAHCTEKSRTWPPVFQYFVSERGRRRRGEGTQTRQTRHARVFFVRRGAKVPAREPIAPTATRKALSHVKPLIDQDSSAQHSSTTGLAAQQDAHPTATLPLADVGNSIASQKGPHNCQCAYGMYPTRLASETGHVFPHHHQGHCHPLKPCWTVREKRASVRVGPERGGGIGSFAAYSQANAGKQQSPHLLRQGFFPVPEAARQGEEASHRIGSDRRQEGTGGVSTRGWSGDQRLQNTRKKRAVHGTTEKKIGAARSKLGANERRGAEKGCPSLD